MNPFGTPAQVVGDARGAPSVQADNARLQQGGTLMAVNSGGPLPYQIQPHQLQSLQQHQMLMPNMAMPPQHLSYLPGHPNGIHPQLSFMPPGSMGPMAHAMPLNSLPPPTIGMPLPPMHRAYPGLEVW
tara:strand:- start:317 stop:700 length:384 start_codon:yes stop_codon:yes gene_type:complete